MASNSLARTSITTFDHAYDQVLAEAKVDVGQVRKDVLGFHENNFNPTLVSCSHCLSMPSISSLLNDISDTALILQQVYISNNPNPVGSKNNLQVSSLNIEYDQEHKKEHTYFSKVQEQFGFYDIFFINTKGNIIYSVFKEVDFATSLVTGPYRNSGLAKSYESALKLNDGELAFVDFSLYVPSYNAPVGFIATPVFNESSEKIGVLAIQFPIDKLNAKMSDRTGLGETGEVYLVGDDLRMRSDSYLDSDNYSVVESFRNGDEGKVETEAVKRALAGETGTGIILNYKGDEVLSAFSPFTLKGLHWPLLPK